MIRAFVRHDDTTWRRHYDAFGTERRTTGECGQAVYQAAENRNDVTVTHDFDALHAAQVRLRGPESVRS